MQGATAALVLALAVAAPGAAQTPPAGAPSAATRAMERHVCGVVAMYRDCAARADRILEGSRGGSETLPDRPGALAVTGMEQCAQILRRLESWERACEATRPGDPAQAIDCAVFRRREFPQGTC